VHGVLIYCSDYRCSHSTCLDADRWADDIRLSDIDPKFVCAACGRRVLTSGRIGDRWSRGSDENAHATNRS